MGTTKVLVKDMPQTQANIYLTQKQKLKENGVNFTQFIHFALEQYSEEYSNKKKNGTLDMFLHTDLTKATSSVPLGTYHRNIVTKYDIKLAEFSRWVIDLHLEDYLKLKP